MGASSTVDGQFWQTGQLPAGSVTELVVSGRGGVPVDALAVVLNVTVIGASAGGYVSVYPCGGAPGAPPNASNLNYVHGQTIPNAVIAKVDTGGKVCVLSRAAVHLIIDVNGYFPASSSYVPIAPQRFLESRVGASPTVDDDYWQVAGASGRFSH